MSDNTQGTVEYVGRNKDNGMYNIKLDDGEWYGCGRDNPNVSKGDEIAFDFSMNGRWKNADVKTLEVVVKGAAAPAPVKASGGSSNNSREDYWTNKAAIDVEVRKEIRYQASKKSAVEVVKFLVEQGTIDLGKVQKKQMSVFMNYVNGLAAEMSDNVRQFCDDSDPANDSEYPEGEE